jgi:hypothetical protein
VEPFHTAWLACNNRNCNNLNQTPLCVGQGLHVHMKQVERWIHTQGVTDLPKREIFEKVWRNHIEVIVHRWDPSTQPGWLAIMEIGIIMLIKHNPKRKEKR